MGFKILNDIHKIKEKTSVKDKMHNKFITKIVNNVNNSIKKTIMFQAQICIMLFFMIKNILWNVQVEFTLTD